MLFLLFYLNLMFIFCYLIKKKGSIVNLNIKHYYKKSVGVINQLQKGRARLPITTLFPQPFYFPTTWLVFKEFIWEDNSDGRCAHLFLRSNVIFRYTCRKYAIFTKVKSQLFSGHTRDNWNSFWASFFEWDLLCLNEFFTNISSTKLWTQIHFF